MNTTLINGQFENKISVQDRGLQYGDGVFRTLVCNRGSISHFTKHYQKLKQDAKAIHISIPKSSDILGDIQKLCTKEDVKIIKIIITRGESTRGYDYSKMMTPNVIIQSFDYDQKKFVKNQTGVSVETASVLLDKNSISDIKHLNRLINILALAGKPKSIHDRIMLDHKQNIIEGAYHCVFFKHRNKFILPSLNQFGLQGVSRQLLIEYFEKNTIPFIAKPVSYNSVKHFDEMYLMNSVYGIIPVIKYDEFKFKINQSISQQLNSALKFNHV